jgi:hypothetical protein
MIRVAAARDRIEDYSMKAFAASIWICLAA